MEGQRLRTISGWEFKLIVSRVLGWNRLKVHASALCAPDRILFFTGVGLVTVWDFARRVARNGATGLRLRQFWRNTFRHDRAGDGDTETR